MCQQRGSGRVGPWSIKAEASFIFSANTSAVVPLLLPAIELTRQKRLGVALMPEELRCLQCLFEHVPLACHSRAGAAPPAGKTIAVRLGLEMDDVRMHAHRMFARVCQ